MAVLVKQSGGTYALVGIAASYSDDKLYEAVPSETGISCYSYGSMLCTNGWRVIHGNHRWSEELFVVTTDEVSYLW